MSGNSWKPKEYHTLTVGLTVKDSAKAIEFYKKVFGAKEIMRLPMPNGKLMHVEMELGDTRFFLSDEMPEMQTFSPETVGKTTAGFYLYVENVDEVFKHALSSGAKEIAPVQDKFWGDRTGTLEDPFGHRWILATHVKDVSPEEIRKGVEAFWGAVAKR
jgi:PhnB protein